ncbi:MAG: hypothetical protein LBV78_09955 [Kitasatospora sp.]|jgi:hypothetical protein|nr:hypothetical protein [Kitasatospora sp.]
MLIAGTLNFLQSQASVALDPQAAAEHRQHADDEISDTVPRLPAPGLITPLIELAAPFTSRATTSPGPAKPGPAASATGVGATN